MVPIFSISKLFDGSRAESSNFSSAKNLSGASAKLHGIRALSTGRTSAAGKRREGRSGGAGAYKQRLDQGEGRGDDAEFALHRVDGVAAFVNRRYANRDQHADESIDHGLF